MPPEISVVIPTHDRPGGLARLLAALGRQTLAPERFEVLVVDDGSTVPAQARGDAPARIIRHQRPRGPAAARNSGWRHATAPLVAFIDDDCTPAEGWLDGLLAAADGAGVVIQGRVLPMPHEPQHPLSHTIEVAGADGLFVSANIAYPRVLLDHLGGFDESFTRACGEDVELGARALRSGALLQFAADAVVYHEVRPMNLRDHVRHTLKWTDSVRALAMHPELRRLLVAGVFWKPTHPWMLASAAALVAGRPRLTAVMVMPYLVHYRRVYGGDLAELVRSLPVHVAVDACEIATAAAGSLRHRTLML